MFKFHPKPIGVILQKFRVVLFDSPVHSDRYIEEMLQSLFRYEVEEAEELMWEVRDEGKPLCGLEVGKSAN